MILLMHNFSKVEPGTPNKFLEEHNVQTYFIKGFRFNISYFRVMERIFIAEGLSC